MTSSARRIASPIHASRPRAVAALLGATLLAVQGTPARADCAPVDLIFILDNSGSVTKARLNDETDWATEVVTGLPADTRAGIVQLSTDAEVVSPLLASRA